MTGGACRGACHSRSPPGVEDPAEAATLRVGLMLEDVVGAAAPSPQRLQYANSIDLLAKRRAHEGLEAQLDLVALSLTVIENKARARQRPVRRI